MDFAGTATFFLLTLMALIDVVAGFSISLFAARRDFSVGERELGDRAAEEAAIRQGSLRMAEMRCRKIAQCPAAADLGLVDFDLERILEHHRDLDFVQAVEFEACDFVSRAERPAAVLAFTSRHGLEHLVQQCQSSNLTVIVSGKLNTWSFARSRTSMRRIAPVDGAEKGRRTCPHLLAETHPDAFVATDGEEQIAVADTRLRGQRRQPR